MIKILCLSLFILLTGEHFALADALASSYDTVSSDRNFNETTTRIMMTSDKSQPALFGSILYLFSLTIWGNVIFYVLRLQKNKSNNYTFWGYIGGVIRRYCVLIFFLISISATIFLFTASNDVIDIFIYIIPILFLILTLSALFYTILYKENPLWKTFYDFFLIEPLKIVATLIPSISFLSIALGIIYLITDNENTIIYIFSPLLALYCITPFLYILFLKYKNRAETAPQLKNTLLAFILATIIALIPLAIEYSLVILLD